MISIDDVVDLNQVLSPTGYPFTKFWFARTISTDHGKKFLYSGINSLEVCVTMAMIRLWMPVDYVLDCRDDSTPACSLQRLLTITRDFGRISRETLRGVVDPSA
jgi:hypothetical protein